MKLSFTVGACALTIAFTAKAIQPTDPAPDQLTFPQKRGAVYDEIRAYQALGRFAIAPNANFFLYEWSQAYVWAPDYKGLSKSTAARKQTFIFKVDLSDDTSQNKTPTSEYLFYPAAGTTYYMGNLSPDASMIAFYALDWDDKTIRVGMTHTNDGISPKITWYTVPPDDARLNEPATWISNEEFVYPVKTGSVSKLVIADSRTGQTKPCTECSPRTIVEAEAEAAELARSNASRNAKPDGGSVVAGAAGTTASVPKNAKLIAQAQNGALSIYSVDTPDVLTLLYKKEDQVNILFENDRKPAKRTAAKEPGKEIGTPAAELQQHDLNIIRAYGKNEHGGIFTPSQNTRPKPGV